MFYKDIYVKSVTCARFTTFSLERKEIIIKDRKIENRVIKSPVGNFTVR